MNREQQQQQIEQAVTGTQQQTQQQIQQQVDKLVKEFRPAIDQMLLIGVLFLVAIILLKFMDSMHKWRIERAILRMDKNLEKLVAVQVPEVEEKKSSDKDESEQK